MHRCSDGCHSLHLQWLISKFEYDTQYRSGKLAIAEHFKWCFSKYRSFYNPYQLPQLKIKLEWILHSSKISTNFSEIACWVNRCRIWSRMFPHMVGWSCLLLFGLLLSFFLQITSKTIYSQYHTISFRRVHVPKPQSYYVWITLTKTQVFSWRH